MIQDMAKMVQKGTMDLSTKKSFSQIASVNYLFAKPWRVVPVGQASIALSKYVLGMVYCGAGD